MKKWLSLILVLLLALSGTTALAAGSLSDAARGKRPVPAADANPGADPAPAEASTSIDLSALSNDELQALIDAAQAELAGRVGTGPAASDVVGDGSILYEDENLRITMTGSLELDEYGALILNVVLENLTNRNLIMSLENASCNGWDVDSPVASVSANKKAKETLEFYDAAEDAELTAATDVRSIEGQIRYFDEDDYDFTVENESTVIWNFQ